MEKEYKGIKIYDNVIIVQRDKIRGEQYNAGYVVEPGNEKMLNTANDWATTYKQKKQNATQYEYSNGNFTLALYEAAEYSSFSGKLSFWNCLITAPDGKEFLIGINASILINLMKATTFVNGVCSEKVYLGRIKGNQVGAFVPAMDEFAQAEEDKKIRAGSKNTDYKQFDVIIDLRNKKELYLGEIYSYGNIEHIVQTSRNGVSYAASGNIFISDPITKYMYYDMTTGYFTLKDKKSAKITIDSDEKKGKKILEKINKHDRYKITNIRNTDAAFYNGIFFRTQKNLKEEDLLKDIEEFKEYINKRYSLDTEEVKKELETYRTSKQYEPWRDTEINAKLRLYDLYKSKYKFLDRKTIKTMKLVDELDFYIENWMM